MTSSYLFTGNSQELGRSKPSPFTEKPEYTSCEWQKGAQQENKDDDDGDEKEREEELRGKRRGESRKDPLIRMYGHLHQFHVQTRKPQVYVAASQDTRPPRFVFKFGKTLLQGGCDKILCILQRNEFIINRSPR